VWVWLGWSNRSDRVAFVCVVCIGCMAVTDDCMCGLRVMYVQELLGFSVCVGLTGWSGIGVSRVAF